MEPKLDLKEMFAGLCDRIRSRKPEWPGSGPEWTQEIVFAHFRNLAEGRYQVRHRELAERGEWLFDLIWTVGDPRGEDFKSLVLALECEWGCGVGT